MGNLEMPSTPTDILRGDAFGDLLSAATRTQSHSHCQRVEGITRYVFQYNRFIYVSVLLSAPLRDPPTLDPFAYLGTAPVTVNGWDCSITLDPEKVPKIEPSNRSSLGEKE